jgi:hypothetical protein
MLGRASDSFGNGTVHVASFNGLRRLYSSLLDFNPHPVLRSGYYTLSVSSLSRSDLIRVVAYCTYG